MSRIEYFWKNIDKKENLGKITLENGDFWLHA